MLEDLKDVVQSLTADDLLPPALLSQPHHRSGEPSEAPDDGEEEEEGEGEEEAEEEEEAEAMDQDEEDEEEMSVDILAFEIPETETLGTGIKLRRNPLAMLMPHSDISSYFASSKKSRSHAGDGDSPSSDWVLNVNFGNESLESVLRVRLSTGASSMPDKLHGDQVGRCLAALATHFELGQDSMPQGSTSPLRPASCRKLPPASVDVDADHGRLGAGLAAGDFMQVLSVLAHFGYLSPL